MFPPTAFTANKIKREQFSGPFVSPIHANVSVSQNCIYVDFLVFAGVPRMSFSPPPPSPTFHPTVFRTRRRFNPGFSTRFDTLHSGLYALTRLTQHGTPCSYYCSYDPPILDRFILFHPRFSHYLVQPLSTTSYPFLSRCLLPFSHSFDVQAISEFRAL